MVLQVQLKVKNSLHSTHTKRFLTFILIINNIFTKIHTKNIFFPAT